MLRIGADDLEWLARYLAYLSCRFTVLEPTELRGAISDLALRLQEDTADH